MRKLLVLFIAVAALAFASAAQAASLTLIAPFASQTQTVTDANNDGAPELILIRGQLLTPAGAYVGYYQGRVVFIGPGLATLQLVFRYPFEWVYAVGPFNPEAGSPIVLQARPLGLGPPNWNGTVTATQTTNATQIVFQRG